MYAKYSYQTGLIQSNLLNDLTLILSGTTDKATLSANCNQVDTEIISTVPVGWTVYDANPGANKKIFRAQIADDVAQFKYVELDVSTAGQIKFFIYEAWNAVAHTGTNKSANVSYYLRYDTAGTGQVYLWADARKILCYTTYGVSLGDNAYAGSYVMAETSRIQPWDTVAAAYPKSVIIPGGQGYFSGTTRAIFFCRVKNRSNTDLTGASAIAFPMTVGCYCGQEMVSTSRYPVNTGALVPDATGVLRIPLMPIYLGDAPVFSIPVADISQVAEVYQSPTGIMTAFETVVISGVTWQAVPINANAMFYLVKKG